MSPVRGDVVVAGIGSEYRRDDGVGVEVARVLAAASSDVVDVGPIGEPLDLLGRWDDVGLAVVVDAVRGEESPGTIHVLELDPDRRSGAGDPMSGAGSLASTHGLGVIDVLRLARAVGAAPRRVVLVGVVGECFDAGIGLSEAVGRAVPAAASLVLALLDGGS
ncbi:MAG TPA: hydrogenase maturation protease [Acidimicrobiales bacterium]|nr:hydrogenase maturation protease [Acidimicrobiales bacterium]